MPELRVLFCLTDEELVHSVQAAATLFMPKIRLRVTTNDKFMEQDIIPKIDAVVVYATNSADELEMQEEYLMNYLKAPITVLAVGEEVADGFKLSDEMQSKVGETISPAPKLTGDSVKAEWGPIFEKMLAAKAEKEDKVLGAIFKEFDKDNSGAIDKAELKAMMEKLGTVMDDEMVEAALLDLDLNGDGVIDFGEMKRWYMSGMQPYSERTRGLRQMRAQVGAMTSGMADPELIELVKANQDKYITQKLCVAFNEPNDADCGLDTKVRVNLFGQEYEKYAAACQAFTADFEGFQPDDKKVYFDLELEGFSNEAIEAFKAGTDGLLAGLGDQLSGDGERKPKMSFEYPEGKILFQFAISEPGAGRATKKVPRIPEEIVKALAGQDQFLEVHFRYGSSPTEIMGGLPFAEAVKKGFSLKAELKYLKCLKKVLAKVPALTKPMEAAGFGLKLSADASINLSYDDIEELKENELLSKFVDMDVNALFEQFGIDKDELMNYECACPEVENPPDQVKPMVAYLKFMNAWTKLLGASPGKISVGLNAVFEGVGHVQIQTTGDGYGPLTCLTTNKATQPVREQMAQMIPMIAGM